jgi:flagellin
VSRPQIRNFKMALAIATNNAALNAAASASSVNRDMETSMARLSSGKRINSASDDAAGVAISSRLSAEIRGTDQAIRNALDGQALIDTAEGAHSEIENILQRMREVAVQAANDTNNDQDRLNLQAEIDALVTEINRIASTTTWAGEKLMEAELGTDFSFQVGAKTAAPNQISIKINGMGSHALGLKADPADTAPAPADYLVRQATVSGTGVVTENNGNTSVTLQKLGIVTTTADVDNTPTIAATSSTLATLTINDAARDAGFTITLESGVDVVVPSKAENSGTAKTLAEIAELVNDGKGAVVASPGAVLGDEGHGYTGAVVTDGISISAGGAITLATDVTTVTGTPSAANVAVSTVTTATTTSGLGDVTYAPNDPASVNAAATAINAGTATTNIVATVGADGSGNSGKIILTYQVADPVVAGLGSHSDLTKLQDLVAFDAANTVPFATMEVSGTTGILTFNENATSINLVLGKTTATGAAGAKSSITIDATADLQTAVDAINGTAGAGTTEHGYTASIVAAPGGGSLAGTIKLVQGTKHADLTQTSLANLIDNGANGVGAIAKQQPAAGPAQDMDVKTASKALEAIDAVDSAIQTVNIQRSTLGAVSNRLSHTINNLTNISTNLSAAQGGIEDADFAHETTMLAKNQILQQASTAMLAQANASKQNVLSLLQG